MSRELVVDFLVPGKPRTAGSKTSFVPKRKDGSFVRRPDGRPMVVTHDSSGSDGEQWRSRVMEKAALAVRDEYRETDSLDELVEMIEPVEGPLAVEVVYYLQRPKSHYRTGRNAHLLRDGAPAYPATKPDLGKLSRAVQDSLSGLIYRDDAQIVENREMKVYGSPERARVRIERVTDAVQSAPVEQVALVV
ncbi:MAG: RusA family crossover junction endodeoxyribonuclease [Chloroflexi bacterium]|nr:RusA family crossover junction endodeoxyribonuclease [Chloroflexota bacterium]